LTPLNLRRKKRSYESGAAENSRLASTTWNYFINGRHSLATNMANANLPPPAPVNPQNPPLLALLVGVVFGLITLSFLIALVGANMAGYDIPCASRLPVMLIFSLCAAFSAAFLGGYLTANGQIAIPGLNLTPVQFGAGGGIAVLLIFPIVGWQLYVRGCETPTVNPPLLHSAVLAGNVAQLMFDDSHPPPGYAIRPQFSSDRSFASITVGRAIDSPAAGQADEGLPAGMKPPCWVRLAVYSPSNRFVPNSASEAKELKEPNP